MKQEQKFTTNYFYNSMPKWKRVKDPFLTRIFYRPVSFYLASVCANRNISANTVSYLSAIVAVVACLLFLPNCYWANVLGAALFNVWLIMDCIDGNLARGVKKQPFGVFADSMSSYTLVAFGITACGFRCCVDGGLLTEPGCVWMLLAGAVASSSDTLMRLIYQKYKATERELQDLGVLQVEHDVRLDNSQTNNWRVRLESDWGIGGVLPFFVLLGTIFHALDLVVLYSLVYYGGSCLVTTLSLVRKALRAQRKYSL